MPNIPVRIYGKDYSEIKYNLLDENLCDYNSDKVGIVFPDEETLSEYLEIEIGDSQRKAIARLVVESFLYNIERDDSYKECILTSDFKKKDDKKHFFGKSLNMKSLS